MSNRPHLRPKLEDNVPKRVRDRWALHDKLRSVAAETGQGVPPPPKVRTVSMSMLPRRAAK